MFYIIETDKQLAKFKEKNYKQGFIEIILKDPNVHPKLNEISLIYFHPYNGYKGYIFCVDHAETLSLSLASVLDYLNTLDVIYVLSKSRHLYFLEKLQNKLVDIELSYFLKNQEKLEININSKCIQFYSNLVNSNYYIPISKHYERLEATWKAIKWENTNFTSNEFLFYNNAVDYFQILEKNGLKINKDFKVSSASSQDDLVYSQYSLTNITSRPSCKFNRINFLSLSDKNKQFFETRYSSLVSFDYDGYHPRLIARLLNYQFSNDPIHNQLGYYYFNTYDLTPEQYKQSKEITFQNIYGKIDKSLLDIPFFSKIHDFTNELWETFKEKGYIVCPISNRVFYKDKIEKPNKTKLFNYYIQNYETSLNILVLKELTNYLERKISKLVLYQYDSFLLDFSRIDGKQTLIEIQNIIEQQGKFPTKIKVGQNLKDLEVL